MAPSEPVVDGHLSALVDKHVANLTAQADSDADPDALFAALEEEDDSAFHAARAQQLSEELKKYKPATSRQGIRGGQATVTTLKSDDEVLTFTTENARAVVHFFHPEFARCGVMDRHLEEIAVGQRVLGGEEEVKWGRVDVKDAPFVVERMGVRILPCVVGFRDGLVVGRVVGFEGLLWMGPGREDGKETTRALEEKMVEWKVLEKAFVRTQSAQNGEQSDSDPEEQHATRKSIKGRKQKIEDDDDDWD